MEMGEMLVFNKGDSRSQYLEKVKLIRESLNKDKGRWKARFMAQYFPEAEGDHHVDFSNFLFGKSYINGYTGPCFMEALIKFYNDEINQQNNE